MNRPTVNPADKRFQCSDCGLKTGAQFRLDRHQAKLGPVLAKFDCTRCKTKWTSAHAYCKAFQRCKSCKSKTYPRNAEYKQLNEEEKRDHTKPHLAHLCERCTKGQPCSAIGLGADDLGDALAAFSRLRLR